MISASRGGKPLVEMELEKTVRWLSWSEHMYNIPQSCEETENLLADCWTNLRNARWCGYWGCGYNLAKFSVPQVNDSTSILHKLPAIDVNIICNVNIIMDIMPIANTVDVSHGMRRKALALWNKFGRDRWVQQVLDQNLRDSAWI